jgi:hypothetical protein
MKSIILLGGSNLQNDSFVEFKKDVKNEQVILDSLNNTETIINYKTIRV